MIGISVIELENKDSILMTKYAKLIEFQSELLDENRKHIRNKGRIMHRFDQPVNFTDCFELIRCTAIEYLQKSFFRSIFTEETETFIFDEKNRDRENRTCDRLAQRSIR